MCPRTWSFAFSQIWGAISRASRAPPSRKYLIGMAMYVFVNARGLSVDIEGYMTCLRRVSIGG
ncbi:MAG: hypothetical protein FWD46_07840 [Cystobacterineae bacterium]|nr:hypothetical protein [Cystobacterineae bacterium]